MTGANPYRHVGQIAVGERFVGRAGQLRKVRSSWSELGRPGNLSVQGNHRMGKTSLVEQAIQLDGGERKDLLFVKLNVGNYESGVDLFRGMVAASRDAVAGSALPMPAKSRIAISDLAHEAAAHSDWFALSEKLRVFFGTMTECGLYLVVVLDEFDRASSVFTRLADFIFLRDLASESFSPIGLVTISRRPISVVEIDAVGGSTLDGVLSLRCVVGGFVDAEIDMLLRRALAANVDLMSVKPDLLAIAGGHPYLLELLCCELVHQVQAGGPLDVEAAHRALLPQIEDQFSRMVRSLDVDSGNRGEDILARLLRNDAESLRSSDVEMLRRLGIVAPVDPGVGFFSGEFERFVRRMVTVR